MQDALQEKIVWSYQLRQKSKRYIAPDINISTTRCVILTCHYGLLSLLNKKPFPGLNVAGNDVKVWDGCDMPTQMAGVETCGTYNTTGKCIWSSQQSHSGGRENALRLPIYLGCCLRQN